MSILHVACLAPQVRSHQVEVLCIVNRFFRREKVVLFSKEGKK